MLEWRWKLPAPSRYLFLGEIKRLDSLRNQAFSKYLVESCGIESLKGLGPQAARRRRCAFGTGVFDRATHAPPKRKQPPFGDCFSLVEISGIEPLTS